MRASDDSHQPPRGSLKFTGEGRRIALVVAFFNEVVTSKLLDGAQEALSAHHVQDVEIFWVPGALEIPLATRAIAETRQYDAVVAIGTVIRGETYHFETVAQQSAAGIARVSEEFSIPVTNAILTVEDLEQAMERASDGVDNKGYEAALGALYMCNLLDGLRSEVEVGK